ALVHARTEAEADAAADALRAAVEVGKGVGGDVVDGYAPVVTEEITA
ncbi:MAG: hypothetical protein JWM31_2605, partial [Solirubrobacterales bacterium]|nr:hypothetical protein [Solirubrobacterales bacterium]